MCNLIYCISCDRCPDQYVGKTGKALSQRFAKHCGYVRNNKIDQATGEHFNLPGHGLPNMKVTILKILHFDDPQMRKTRENNW